MYLSETSVKVTSVSPTYSSCEFWTTPSGLRSRICFHDVSRNRLNGRLSSRIVATVVGVTAGGFGVDGRPVGLLVCCVRQPVKISASVIEAAAFFQFIIELS